jgi:hypothetical protein
MPLKGVAEHGDKVNLEVRLATGTKGVDVAVGLLVFDVLGHILEVAVDTRKTDELEKAAGHGALVLPAVSRGGSVLLQTGSQEVLVKSVSVLDLEDVRKNRVVKKVLANMFRLDNRVDAELVEFLLRTDARQEQQFGSLINTKRHNDLVLSTERKSLTIRTNDLNTNSLSILKDELLRVGLSKNGDVGLTLQEPPAGGSLAVVDGVNALPETMHLAVVNVISEGLTLADPGLGEGVAPALSLGEEI